MEQDRYGRLVSVLVSPTRTFRSIAEEPTFMVPILVMVLSGVLMLAIGLPRMDWEASISYRLEQRGRELPPEAEAAILRYMENEGVIVMYILMAVMPLLFCPLAAAIFRFAFRRMGSEMTLETSLGVLVHGLMPTVVGFLVSIPFILGAGTLTAEKLDRGFWWNLGFLAGEHPSRAAATFFGQMDLFWLWSIVLLVIGYSVAARASKGLAAFCVVGVWLIFVFALTGLAMLD